MKIADLLGLLGGLSLFLYGMQMMSDGLEEAAGNRMKNILEKLTANRFLGVLVGAGITAAIQSSSATTVMTVGFVNSGMMTLKQAVWIIMGANIGTTITGQLIALDIGLLAPLIAFLGVVMIVFLKKPQLKHWGKILAGFGVLFIGMDMMGGAMNPLRESEAFISIMTTFSNPLFGILAGAVFTAIIQSSSASVGILQTLAVSGLIPFSSAVYVLFGQNIGTCITAVLASIGTNRSAKRTTAIHLMFNIIGTVIFTILCLTLPIENLVASITPSDPSRQIANMHTIFNIATTVLLIPFGTLLAKAAEKILPEKEEQNKNSLTALNEEYRRGRISLGSAAVQLDLLASEIHKMVTLAGANTNKSFQLILDGNPSALEEVTQNEETLDGLNKEISQYISKILVNHHNGENVDDIEQYFLITGNAERIGDHALNIGGYIKTIKDRKIDFSDKAQREIKEMQSIVNKAINKVQNIGGDLTEWLSDIAAMEQKIDDMTKEYRDTHLERMRQGKCSEEACVLYSELLTDFERLGDHILNIAQAYAKINSNK
ncbi:MAG: Na/Pi cotransporter family protein [Oscillospiraceae bacterium]|nr:Na/Pi cotransporter family protein [Oscillospiraceae bacterium]